MGAAGPRRSSAASKGEHESSATRQFSQVAVVAVSILLFVEPDDELSLQALSLAQQLGEVRAVSSAARTRPQPGPRRSPRGRRRDAIVAAGSDRGNELLAHVAAQARPAVRGERDGDRRGRRHPRPLGRVAARGGAAARVAEDPLGGTAYAAGGRARRGRAAHGRHRGRRTRPRDGVGVERRRLAPRREGRRQRRPRRRLGGGIRDHRGARRPARRRSRLLARRHVRGLAARMPTRSARPARRSRPTSTSRAASAARRSTSRARRARRRSSRSTPIPRRRSSRARTTRSSATCTRSCRRSAPS